MRSRRVTLCFVLAALVLGCGHSLVRPVVFEWNPGLELKTAGIREGTIFYAVTGEGAPVLLLHGFGGEIWVWEKQMAALSKRYRLYIPDLIGYGYSDRPKVEYTPALFIDLSGLPNRQECDSCRNYILHTTLGAQHELRHFVTSSYLRSAACAPL